MAPKGGLGGRSGGQKVPKNCHVLFRLQHLTKARSYQTPSKGEFRFVGVERQQLRCRRSHRSEDRRRVSRRLRERRPEYPQRHLQRQRYVVPGNSLRDTRYSIENFIHIILI